MKISSVNFYQPRNIIKQTNINNKQNNYTYNKQDFHYIPTNNFLAFLGSYSTHLDDVQANLKESEYPLDVKKMVDETIESGNIKDKTLYDVHFDKYSDIADCFTLEQLKEKYPEFNNVISAKDVIAKESSVIGEWQCDNSEVFNSDEDLTLQLIKLYWGQGFSLNDLSDYVAISTEDNKGKNLYYAMTKLNIPFMNRRYAQVLKFSNKDYEKKLNGQILDKKEEVREYREQKKNGEPVFIPRKPLSEAHKKHISEGLKRYYKSNPEAIYKLSTRQKKFYEEHPEEKEKISEAADYAWNCTQEGKSIKKYLIKYLKKNKINITDDELNLKIDMKSSNQKAFGDFWKINKWAGKQFSIAMEKGWEYAEFDVSKYLKSTTRDNFYQFHLVPKTAVKEISQYAKKKGVKVDEETAFRVYEDHSSNLTKIQKEKLNKATQDATIMCEEYNSSYPRAYDLYATVKQLALIQMYKDIASGNVDENLMKDKENYNDLIKFLLRVLCDYDICRKNAQNELVQNDGVDSEVIDSAIIALTQYTSFCNLNGIMEHYDKTVDLFYNKHKKQYGIK